MTVASLLTSELQLGQQLNRSVEAGDQADFALLLALLSEDVCEQDQFHFSAQTFVDDKPSLQDSLEVPRAQHLSAQEIDEDQSLALGKLAQEQGMLAARLSHCLNPEALSFSLDKSHDIDTQVFDNLGVHCAANFTGKTVAKHTPKIDLSSVLSAQQNYSAQLVA